MPTCRKYTKSHYVQLIKGSRHFSIACTDPKIALYLPTFSDFSGKQLKNRHESENDEEEELAEAKPPTTIQITSLKSVADLIEGMQKLELPSQALALIRYDLTMLILLFHQGMTTALTVLNNDNGPSECNQ